MDDDALRTEITDLLLRFIAGVCCTATRWPAASAWDPATRSSWGCSASKARSRPAGSPS